MKNRMFHTLILSVCAYFSFAQKNQLNYNLLIGTYTNAGNSEGIYYYQFNADGSSKAISQAKSRRAFLLNYIN
jgi:hypothetical protein